ncbi:hypothetical protein ACAW74_01945 [Fibrella sp. WM1]|uniref:hypothetical protein n=1 Tax=Fibrella musci TaxID=3242485 RepID=UPI0035224D6D
MSTMLPVFLNRRTHLGWLGLCLAMQSALAQPLTQVQARFDTYRKQYLQEKLYVHTDQSAYLPGETLWFRLFYVDGSQHKPLSVSKVAYIELINTEQRAVLQYTVSLGDKGGNGAMNLPMSLPSGTYVLRAYTQWMRGSSPDFFFEKVITLVNPFRKPDLPFKADTLAWSVQSYPEGGQLVAGLPATVAVQATDTKTGRGAAYRGVVLTQANDTVARFNAHRFGIGTFRLTPAPNTTYRLRLTDERGRTVVRPISLPIATKGYSMQVEAGQQEQLQITVRSNVPDQTNPDVFLLGHTRQVIGVSERQILRDGQATFTVPLQQLGEGISHLTVFDATGQPVCERLWFRQPKAALTAQVTTDKGTYAGRAPVALSLVTSRPDGGATIADASVAVFRLDSLAPLDPVNLPEYLWLTSDLHGVVENPAYYLTQTGREADVARNNLMLTHGWRRFRWDAVLNPPQSTTLVLPESRGLTVRGRVLNNRTGQPAADVATFLSVPGQGARLYSRRSDAAGYVRYELPELVGPHELVLQPTQADSSYRVELLSPYAEASATTPLPPFDLAPTLRDALTTRSLTMQVQNHYFAPPLPGPQADSSTFYGRPDEHYRLDAYTRFQTMEEVLSEYVPGVAVKRLSGGRFALRVNNLPGKAFFDDPPLMLIDGVPVFDPDQLMAISPLKFRTLDVMTSRYFLGPLAYSGILNLNSYKQDLAGYRLDPKAVVLDYDGLQARREFAAPSYGTAVQQASRLPDLRQLLYWNPQVMTSAAGKAGLTFYSSDQAGRYQVVVQALTADGHFTTASHTFTVQDVAH